jgi:DnaJ-class molecular chaperone
MQMKDYYAILGVSENAGEEAIKKLCRRYLPTEWGDCVSIYQ